MGKPLFVITSDFYDDNNGAQEIFQLVTSAGVVVESYPCRTGDKAPAFASEHPAAPAWLLAWLETGDSTRVAYISGSRKVASGYYPLSEITERFFNGSFWVDSKAVLAVGGGMIRVSANCCKNWAINASGRLISIG